MVLLTFTSSLFSQVRIGELATDFEYSDTNGEIYKLSDFQGNVVFLAFTILRNAGLADFLLGFI